MLFFVIYLSNYFSNFCLLGERILFLYWAWVSAFGDPLLLLKAFYLFSSSEAGHIDCYIM